MWVRWVSTLLVFWLHLEGHYCVERSYLEIIDHTYVLRVFSRTMEKKTWGMCVELICGPIFILGLLLATFGLLLAFLKVEEARKNSCTGSISVSDSRRKKKSLSIISLLQPFLCLAPTSHSQSRSESMLDIKGTEIYLPSSAWGKKALIFWSQNRERE